MNGAYKVITDRILEHLAAGVVPWRRPWYVAPGEGPRNVRGTFYRGINVMLLECAGYDSPYWLTFGQAKHMGGSVKKGERGTPVVFWKWIDRKRRPADDDDDEQNTRGGGRFPLLRYYTVFNLRQTKAIPDPGETIEESDGKRPAVPPIEAAEAIVAGYPSPPSIANGSRRACYSPTDDAVRMPDRDLFESGEAYYSTLFHELTHSTGHAGRLNRKFGARFGNQPYAREELVAELGAAFLSGRAGIETQIEASASYLENWIKALTGDPKLIVTAAAQAQKAADLILNVTHERKAAETVAA